MTIREKIEQIAALENIETPWHVKRVIGKVELFGSQVSINNDGTSDFVTLEEFQQALTWLVQQSGGTCNFGNKKQKKEQK